MKMFKIQSFFPTIRKQNKPKKKLLKLILTEHHIGGTCRLPIEIVCFVSWCIKATCNKLHSTTDVIFYTGIHPLFPPNDAAQ